MIAIFLCDFNAVYKSYWRKLSTDMLQLSAE